MIQKRTTFNASKLSQTARPIRDTMPNGTNPLEVIVKRWEYNTFKRHKKFLNEILALLPTPQIKAFEVGPDPVTCCGEQPETKQFDEGQFDTFFYSQMAAAGFSDREIRSILAGMDKAGRAFAVDMIGNGPSLEIALKTIYDRYLWQTLEKSGDVGYAKALAVWKRMSRSFREANPITASEITVWNPKVKWIEELSSNGYRLVTSKITKFYLPQIKLTIAQALQEGKQWREITPILNKQAGAGKAWHWRRLIRTESATAIDKAVTKRYEQMGVNYVVWSMARGGCDICAEFNRKIYLLNKAPKRTEDTHPNCRCTKSPKYALAKGEVVTPWP